MVTGLGSQTRQAEADRDGIPWASRPWFPGFSVAPAPAWAIAALRGITFVAEMGEQIRNRETGEG